jgi:hypothetical protein
MIVSRPEGIPVGRWFQEKDTRMKMRDRMLWMVVAAAAGLAGCAVCDTCDDFPAPCSGPNCSQNGLPAYMNGSQAGLPVMGATTPTAPAADDAAGPGPTMPPSSLLAPNVPAVNPATTPTPPAPMESDPK